MNPSNCETPTSHEERFRSRSSGIRCALPQAVRRSRKSFCSGQLFIAGLLALLSSCDPATAPEDQLAATLTLTPSMLDQNTGATVVIAVTNHGTRGITIGGPSGCFLTFEVLNSDGASVSNRPVVSRVCSLNINGRMTIEAGATYQEGMGWSGVVRVDGQAKPLERGTYGIRPLLGVVDHGLVTLPPVVDVVVPVESMDR